MKMQRMIIRNNKQDMREIYHEDNVKWQTPVITENHAFNNITNSRLSDKFTYVAIPWASLIDKHIHMDRSHLTRVFNNISHSSLNSTENHIITVCQHYKYSLIEEFLETLNCEYTLFTPHADIVNDNIQPFPLYAPISPPDSFSKELLYSFVGTHMSHFMSSIREDIFALSHDDDCICVRRENWHYNKDVYDRQLKNIRQNPVDNYISHQKQLYYSKVLSRSNFSLCPAGAGPSSIRIYESLSHGSIPVILSDKLNLPILSEINWNECVISIPESEVSDITRILRAIPEREIKERQHNCLSAYKLVSGDKFIKCIEDFVHEKEKNTII